MKTPRLLIAILLLAAMPFLIGASPPAQDTPLPGDFIVYGVSLAAVSAVIIAIVRKYVYGVSEEGIKIIAAILAVLSYVLATNLNVLESLIPSLPIWLPQVLMGILIFGAVLGLAPGETFGRAVGIFRRR